MAFLQGPGAGNDPYEILSTICTLLVIDEEGGGMDEEDTCSTIKSMMDISDPNDGDLLVLCTRAAGALQERHTALTPDFMSILKSLLTKVGPSAVGALFFGRCNVGELIEDQCRLIQAVLVASPHSPEISRLVSPRSDLMLQTLGLATLPSLTLAVHAQRRVVEVFSHATRQVLWSAVVKPSTGGAPSSSSGGGGRDAGQGQGARPRGKKSSSASASAAPPPREFENVPDSTMNGLTAQLAKVLQTNAAIPPDLFSNAHEELFIAILESIFVIQVKKPESLPMANIQSALMMHLSHQPVDSDILTARSHITLAALVELARRDKGNTMNVRSLLSEVILPLSTQGFAAEGAGSSGGKQGTTFEDPFFPLAGDHDAHSPTRTSAGGGGGIPQIRAVGNGRWQLSPVKWILLDYWAEVYFKDRTPSPPPPAPTSSPPSTTGTSLCPEYLWQWQSDDERYRPYSPADARAMTSAYHNGFGIRIASPESEYFIEFGNMTQLRSGSSRRRSVQFQPVPYRYTPPTTAAVQGSTTPPSSGKKLGTQSGSVTVPPTDWIPTAKGPAWGQLAQLLHELNAYRHVESDVGIRSLVLQLTINLMNLLGNVLSPDGELVSLARDLVHCSSNLAAACEVCLRLCKRSQWKTALANVGLVRVLLHRDPSLEQAGAAADSPPAAKKKKATKKATPKSSSATPQDPVHTLFDLLSPLSHRTASSSTIAPVPIIPATEGKTLSASEKESIRRYLEAAPFDHLCDWLANLTAGAAEKVVPIAVADTTTAERLIEAFHPIIERTIEKALAVPLLFQAKKPETKKSRKTTRSGTASAAAQVQSPAALSGAQQLVRVSSSLPRVTYPVVLCRGADDASKEKPKCPRKHTLVAHHSTSWTCNLCDRHEETGSMACRKCNYDICSSCLNVEMEQRFRVSSLATVGQLLHTAFGGQRHDGGTGAAFAMLAAFFGAPEELLAQQMQSQQVKLSAMDPEILCAGGKALPSTLPVASLLYYENASQLSSSAREALLAGVPFPEGSKDLTVHCAVSAKAPTCRCGTRHRNRELGDALPLGSGTPSQLSLPEFVPPILQTFYSEAGGTLKGNLVVTAETEHKIKSFLSAAAKEIALFSFVIVQSHPLWRILEGFGRFFSLDFRREIARFVYFGSWRFLIENVAKAGLPAGGNVRVDVAPSADKVRLLAVRGDGVIKAAETIFQQLPPIRSRLDIQFKGEAGTGEGPNQEFYAEVAMALCRKKDMWRLTDEGLLPPELFPSRSSKFAREFYVLGACFARSFLDGFWMTLPLNPAMWGLLQWDASMNSAPHEVDEYIEELDPQLHTQLTTILNADDHTLTSMGLELDDEEGTLVTKANVLGYVQAAAREPLAAAKNNIEAFANGFRVFLPLAVLSMFHRSELNTLFCGVYDETTPRFTTEELRTVVVGAHGYSSDSPEVLQFIEVLTELSIKEQTYFVEWLTGSPQLPPGGITQLGRPIQVVKKDMSGGNRGTLPSCNTCFLYVKLPSYNTKGVLANRLKLAITEGRKNFSLS